MKFTFEEINEKIMEPIGFPYNYYFFPEGEVPDPPYLLFYYPNRNDLIADNINYVYIPQLNIELYTNEKNFTAEKAVEDVLISNGIAFSKSESYIDSENLYEVLYITEVINNAE